MIAKAKALGWEDGYFVKDYVKSNSGSAGSIAKSPEDIPKILEELKKYRGYIEGGVALRRVASYKEDSERRYFVGNQRVFTSSGQESLEPIFDKPITRSFEVFVNLFE